MLNYNNITKQGTKMKPQPNPVRNRFTVSKQVTKQYQSKPWKEVTNPCWRGKAVYGKVADKDTKLSTVLAFNFTPAGQLVLETLNSRYECKFVVNNDFLNINDVADHRVEFIHHLNTLATDVPATQPRKPQTELQKINCMTRWLCSFSIQPIPTHHLDKVQASAVSKLLLAKYNETGRLLKESLELDYLATKDRLQGNANANANAKFVKTIVNPAMVYGKLVGEINGKIVTLSNLELTTMATIETSTALYNIQWTDEAIKEAWSPDVPF